MNLNPEKHGLTDRGDRWEAEAELNALVAAQYGVGKKEFAYLMDTLFMTPQHQEEHTLMKEDILAKL